MVLAYKAVEDSFVLSESVIIAIPLIQGGISPNAF